MKKVLSKSKVKTRKTNEQSKTKKLIGDSENTLSATMSEHSELSEDSMNGNEKQPTDATKPKAIRYCARCLGHSIRLVFGGGHKRYCPFLRCLCPSCLSVVNRRLVVADDTSRRRAANVENYTITDEKLQRFLSFFSTPRVPRNLEWDILNLNKDYMDVSTFAEPPPPYSYVQATSHMSQEELSCHKIELLLEYSHRFEEILPKEESFYSQAITLRYIILKSAKGDPVEAMRLITEAVTAFNLKSSWDTILTQILSFIIYLSTT